MKRATDKVFCGKALKVMLLVFVCITFRFSPSTFLALRAQAPGTAPVKVSSEIQVVHGKRYFVHIVEKGQTVYSISKAYKVESYDAVTHVDIHFLHPGDTVWIPCRNQNATTPLPVEQASPKSPQQQTTKPTNKDSRKPVTVPPTVTHPTPVVHSAASGDARPSRSVGSVVKVALIMPLHLGEMEEISTTKFDIEQRGKRTYHQFEFIEFYEGIRMALDQLAEEGINSEINVVDIATQSADEVKRLFNEHHLTESDVIISLLFRDAFTQAAELARDAKVYIVNPMTTRSEVCQDNPYVVKIQPSLAGQVSTMLDNIKSEHPNGQLFVIHSGNKEERVILEEIKKQLIQRGDLRYTLFNWSQYAKLTQFLKANPSSSVLSIYNEGRDKNRIYVSNLLNRLASFKSNTPTLYTFNDWTRELPDVDFAQLQQVGYHTFATGWNMTNNIHVDFLKAFRTHYGTEPTSTLASTGYDLTLYIVGGLAKKGTSFWLAPTLPSPTLTSPLHLIRSGEGLENDRSLLYRLESLRFIPAN